MSLPAHQSCGALALFASSLLLTPALIDSRVGVDPKPVAAPDPDAAGAADDDADADAAVTGTGDGAAEVAVRTRNSP